MTTARNENTTPSFEILEPRVLLDGDITATLAGSTLVIEGDAHSNAVIVYGTVTPGEFVVDGVTGSQTTVNGSGFSLFDGVTSVKINMGQGDDVLLIGNPGIGVTTTISGNLSIDMGGGTKDGVYIGYDNTALDYLGNVDIGGSLTIQGSDAEDIVRISGMSVEKNVTIKLGDSPVGKVNTVFMNQNATTATSNFIGGKLSMTGGDGIDSGFIGYTEIMGSAQFKLGETPAIQTDRISINRSTIHGAVKITGGGGTEEIEVFNSTLSSVSVQLKGSEGAFFRDAVLFDGSQVNGNVKISGNGNCDLRVFNNSEVFGNLSIRGKGGALLVVDNSSVTGKVNVSGSDASIILQLGATITGDVAVKGKLESTLESYQSSTIDGNVKFNGGSGQDLFILDAGCEVTGSVKINFRTPEDGQDEGVLIIGHVGGDLSVTGGSGRENIDIDNATIDGNLKLDLKDTQVAGIGSTSDVDIIAAVIRGDVSIRSKGKLETFLAGSQIDGTINMKLGKAADKVEIEDCVFGGSFILDTSHGSDTLDIDWAGTVGSNFVGTVTVKMGNDGDLVSVGNVFGTGVGVTFQSECSFDGGSGFDWFRALSPNYGNDFQLGVPNYTNFEQVS